MNENRERGLGSGGPVGAALEPDYYREVFEALGQAVFVLDLDGRVLQANERACAMLGCTHDEALALTADQLSGPELTSPELGARLEQEGAVDLEVPLRRRTGGTFSSEMSLRLATIAGARRVVVCARDTSDKGQAGRPLRESGERFTRVFNSSTNLVAFTEPVRGAIVEVNDTWVKQTGIRREDAIGRSALELGLWSRLIDREACMTELASQGHLREHATRLHTRGGDRHFAVNAEQVEVQAQRYVLWEFRDTTERVLAEEHQQRRFAQLMESEKLESLARLAGGVAHDFAGVLTAIQGCVGMLQKALDPGTPLRAEADEIQLAGERAEALITQLLTFSRQQVLQPRVLDLNQALSRVEPRIRRAVGPEIVTVAELSREGGSVQTDPDKLEQILLHLALNARDAMPGGGTLTLRTSRVDVAAPPTSAPVEARPGPYLLIEVTDSGAGMDAETQRHVFDPFFPTAAGGAGTGLGLSIVYGIVTQSGGWVEVRSAVGAGSTFAVYLPRVESPVRPAAEHPSAPHEGATILLVDDQAETVRVTRRMLVRLGYRVLDAASGEDALALVATLERPPDLLVTDIVMPGMSGHALARALATRHPGLHVLFVSGRPDGGATGAVEQAGSPFLQKPYGLDRLGHKVREALGAPASPPRVDGAAGPGL